MEVSNEVILHQATFNPKVKTYIFFVVIWFLLISVIGIIVIPFWVFGLGQWVSGKFFKTLSCELSNKNLKFSKGLIVHIEKTIPLENIQDLSFVGGPVLRYFGLTLIKVETAGGGGAAHSQNMMSMLGVEHAESFKTQILNQRELILNQKYHPQVNESSNGDLNLQVLNEIKEELIAIKEVLKKQ